MHRNSQSGPAFPDASEFAKRSGLEKLIEKITVAEQAYESGYTSTVSHTKTIVEAIEVVLDGAILAGANLTGVDLPDVNVTRGSEDYAD